MDKLIYYRGKELVTAEQKDLAIKLWGKANYNSFFEYDQYQAYPTGLYGVYQIMMTIEHDEALLAERDALIERIKKTLPKGLTPSRSYYGVSVEHNMLNDLLVKAQKVYNASVDPEDRLETWDVSWEEVLRLFGLPRSGKSVVKLIEDQVSFLENGRPKSRGASKIKFVYELNRNDPTSSYKQYYVSGKLGFLFHDESYVGFLPKELRKYVGKIYNTYDGYFQLYVYDYRDSDDIAQQVIQHLIKAGKLTLTKTKKTVIDDDELIDN